MTKLTINRKPKGIYGTPQKTTQAAQEQDKTTSAHKVMPGNQKAQQKPTGATPWRHMTKRQRKNRRRINRLTELWPELFSREAPKPLKVGIFDDLMQDLAVRGLAFGPGALRATIKVLSRRLIVNLRQSLCFTLLTMNMGAMESGNYPGLTIAPKLVRKPRRFWLT